MAATSWRGVKKLRAHTYGEAARAVGVSKRTVQDWVRKHGLHAHVEWRPHLIIGEDLITFLRKRAVERKVPLSLSQFYCFKCRASRDPALGMVDCDLSQPGAAALTALCAVCETTVKKRVPRRRLPEFWHLLAERSQQA